VIYQIIDAYVKYITKLIAFFMYLLLFSVGLQIAGRYIPCIPRYLWTLEIQQYSLIWMIFCGSIVGLREKKHFTIDIFGKNLDSKLNKIINLLYFIVLYSVTFVFTFYGFRYFVKWGLIITSNITGINMGFLYFSIPFSGISWFIVLTEDLYKTYFEKNQLNFKREKN